jgi:hypothetical protein
MVSVFNHYRGVNKAPPEVGASNVKDPISSVVIGIVFI